MSNGYDGGQNNRRRGLLETIVGPHMKDVPNIVANPGRSGDREIADHIYRATQAGYGYGGTTQDVARKELAAEQAANIETVGGYHSIADVPVLGPAVKGIFDNTPLGVLRLLFPEGMDRVVTGKDPSGASPGSWDEPNRVFEGNISNPKMAMEMIGALDIHPYEKMQYAERMNRIERLYAADRNIEMMDAMTQGSEANLLGRYYDPGVIADLKNRRKLGELPGPQAREHIDAFVRGVEGMEARKQYMSEAYTKAIERRQDEEALLKAVEDNTWEDLGGRWVQLYDYSTNPKGVPMKDPSSGKYVQIYAHNRARKLPGGGIERDENNRPIVDTVYNERRLVTDATFQTPEERILAQVAEREMTRSNSITGEGENVAAMAAAIYPSLRVLRSTKPRLDPGRIGGEFGRLANTLGNWMSYGAGLHGLTNDDLWDRDKLQEAEGLLGQAAETGLDNLSRFGLRKPEAGDSWDWIEGIVQQIMPDSASTGANAQKIQIEQAKLRGVIFQMAVFMAQGRSQGRLSKTATSPRAASEAEIERIRKEMAKIATPAALAEYVAASIGGMISRSDRRAEMFRFTPGKFGDGVIPMPTGASTVLERANMRQMLGTPLGMDVPVTNQDMIDSFYRAFQFDRVYRDFGTPPPPAVPRHTGADGNPLDLRQLEAMLLAGAITMSEFEQLANDLAVQQGR